jgi:hypothetical protein
MSALVLVASIYRIGCSDIRMQLSAVSLQQKAGLADG